MKHFEGNRMVGLRDRQTNSLVAVYPYPVSGSDANIEDKVKFWYYQKSCSSEDVVLRCDVDTLTESELARYNKNPEKYKAGEADCSPEDGRRCH